MMVFDAINNQMRGTIAPVVFYAGACRAFVPTREDGNRLVMPSVPIPTADQQELINIGHYKSASTSTQELAELVTRYEHVFIQIDQELHGASAVIGAPLAAAQWNAESNSWQTQFNRACSKP